MKRAAPQGRPEDALLAVGGQAVLEGVLMRSRDRAVVAVRRPDGDVTVCSQRVASLAERQWWARLPIVRGVVTILEGISVGSWAIMLSGNVAAAHLPISPSRMRGAVARGLAFAVVVFFLLPAAVARMLAGVVQTAGVQSAAESVLQLALVVGFLAAVARIPEIRRVYEYHGAEHKAVAAFESGRPLTTSAVRASSRFHPRCGTTFLFVVVLWSIVVFPLLGRPGLLEQLAERVALLPLLVGLGYEAIRLGWRAPVARALLAPGLWLQRITTREPDDDELEVAIAALQAVVADPPATSDAAPQGEHGVGGNDCLRHPPEMCRVTDPSYGDAPCPTRRKDAS